MTVIRKTKSLQRVLDMFEATSDALSVVELVDRLKNDMNKTTVYRVLQRLEESGTIHSFMDKDGLTWYAACHGCTTDHHTDLHPHFQCERCGKVECWSFEVSVPTLPNYTVRSSELLLVGECNSCVAAPSI